MISSGDDIMGELPKTSLPRTYTQQNTINACNSLNPNPNSRHIPNTPTLQHFHKKNTSLKQQKITLFLTKKPSTHTHSTTKHHKPQLSKSKPSSASKNTSKVKNQVNSFDISCIQCNLHKCKAAWDTLVINHLKTNNPIMLITEPYYNIDNKIPKVHRDLIHYYDRDGTLGPRASISIHKNLEDQCWELKNFTKNFILASIYMENSTDTPNFPPESFSNLSNYALKSDLPLIIASDTNSHNVIWGDKKTEVRGETLLDTLNTLDLHWANKGKQPTFVNSRGHSSIIDLTIGNKKGMEIVHNW